MPWRAPGLGSSATPWAGLGAGQDRTTGQPQMSQGKSPWLSQGLGVGGRHELPGSEATGWPQGSSPSSLTFQELVWTRRSLLWPAELPEVT